MPGRALRRFLCSILGPLIDADDGDLFHIYQQVGDAPNDPWLGILENLRLKTRRADDCGRPKIGGQRISWAWLTSLAPADCRYQFRFYAGGIYDLVVALDIPAVFRTKSRYAFPRIEALGILLARFRSAGDMFELTTKYYCSQGAISELVNELSEFLDERWSHLLDFDANELFSQQRMSEYAAAVHAAGAPLQFVWAFIDCTIRAMCRPTWWQRIVYNGYKKIHATKYQGLTLPNGHIGHLFGPIEGRRNDNALLADSHLLEKCAQFAFRPGADHNTPIAQRYFQLFGDPAYGVTPLILSPFAGLGERTEDEAAWNAAMAAVRIEVEHSFGNVTRLWPFLNAWWKHRVYSSPISRYYRVCVLLTNARNCVRPNQTSRYFRLSPPSLEEYFHE